MLRWIIALTAILGACDKSDTAGGGGSGGGGTGAIPKLFLGPSEMAAPQGLAQLSAGDIPNAINNDFTFFLKNPPKSASGSGDECETQLAKTLKVKATAKEIILDGVGTAKECLPNPKDPGTKVRSAQLRMQLYARCNDADLSSYDGMTYKQFQDTSFKCTDGITTYAFQYNVSQQITGNGLQLAVDLTLRATQFTADGSPCTIQKAGSGGLINNCLITKTSVAGPISVTGDKASSISNPRSLFPNTYAQYLFKAAEFGRPDDQFYRSGAIDFKINNWSGTMTYAGAANPKWTGTNGTNSASGEFKPTL
jgi:hypothetical protein